MQPDETLTGTHPAEPAPGSFRAVAGGEADLFDLDHYPVNAICRVCRAPIWAEAFLRPFSHELRARWQKAPSYRARNPPISRGDDPPYPAGCGRDGKRRHRIAPVTRPISRGDDPPYPAGCGRDGKRRHRLAPVTRPSPGGTTPVPPDVRRRAPHENGGLAARARSPAPRTPGSLRQSPAVSDTARCPWPTCPSARSSTGLPEAVACCSAAHILYPCSGSTRESLLNTVNSTAGYSTPSRTRWYGE